MGRWFLFGMTLSFITVAGGVLLFKWWQSTDRIAFGVRVQGVNVGGLKASQASQTLNLSFTPPFERVTVPVICDGKVIQRIKLRDLNIRPDVHRAVKMALEVGRRQTMLMSLKEFLIACQKGVNLPMPCLLDEVKAKAFLKQLAQRLDTPPQRAQVKLEGGSIKIVPSRNGLVVDVERTLRLWWERSDEGKWEGLPVLMKTVRPDVTTDDVSEIDGVVGVATTYFRTGERNRAHNIRLAASRLDHVLIRPKETISFNELVGPRTPKFGFKKARVLVRGEFTQDFGGGVCQVAGTLYLAALRAGMDVVQRHRHSRIVGYLPAGLDATVNFGSLDLKLRNPFPTPLYILTSVKGGRLTVFILGKRNPGRTYRIVRIVKEIGAESETQPPTSLHSESVRDATSEAKKGYRVTVLRLTVESGVVLKRERISTDTYLLQPKRAKVVRSSGTQTEPPKPDVPSLTNGFQDHQPQ